MRSANRKDSCQTKPTLGCNPKNHVFKKHTLSKYSILTMLLLATLVISGCQFPGTVKGNTPVQQEFPKDYEVAVIRTSDYVEPTYIEYYDEDLNPIATTEYPYICLENMSSGPSIFDDIVYMPHRGSSIEGRNGGQVVGISSKTGEVVEYPATASELTATSKHIFTVRPSTGGAKIGQVDKETGESQDIAPGGYILGPLATDGETVIIAQNSLGDEDWTLLVFSDITDIKEVKMTGLGYPGPITYTSDDKFYFSAAKLDLNTEEHTHTLNYYSLDDGQIHTFAQYTNFMSFIVENDGSLFVMQGDINVANGNEILVIDKATEQIMSAVSIPFFPEYMKQHNGHLYLLGFYKNTGDPCLVKYRIDGSDLIYVTENKLDDGLTKSGKSAGTPYFATGMFFED
ncbi:hypothetical protein FACS1894104_1470 [Actinomycetota bacterium]|nr:hypothetical protein FACS1894104_1470 [Actinomycetota bacterium]